MDTVDNYYYRANLAAKKPIDPMSKTPILDKVIWLTGLVVDRKRAWMHSIAFDQSIKTFREVFSEVTSFFDEPDTFDKYKPAVDTGNYKSLYQDEFPPRHYQLLLDLDNELRDTFRLRNESILQNRDANYLIDNLLYLILPTYAFEYKGIFRDKSIAVMVNPDLPILERNIAHDNLSFSSNICIALLSWSKKIIEYIKLYAPELYERHREIIEYYLNDGDDSPNLNNNEPRLTKTDIQLQWKGDKTDLAELVWVLAKSNRINNSITGQPVTQKELATQFLALFGLDSLEVANLMKGRYGTESKPTTYKAQDGRTFINSLLSLLKERIMN